MEISDARKERLRKLIDYFLYGTKFLHEYDPAQDRVQIPLYKSSVLEFKRIARSLFPKGSDSRRDLDALSVDSTDFWSLLAVHSELYFLIMDVQEVIESKNAASVSPPTASLKRFLRAKDLPPVEEEFERCQAYVKSDPRAAITGACSIFESVCKVYIEDNNLQMPSNKSIMPLWKAVRAHVGLSPSSRGISEVNKMLNGLVSVLQSIGSFRTHAGSAHGRGRNQPRVDSKHARLAVLASYTVMTFVLETWLQTN